MLVPVKPLLLIICCLMAVVRASAQPSAAMEPGGPDTLNPDVRHTIRTILVQGARKTRPHIIRREFALEEGRSYLCPTSFQAYVPPVRISSTRRFSWT
ncbi:MAG: hypothetical protein LW694_02445 [Chitinophagaceae bacterium]|nr:hypothetical protein [Chitinophagaceae bacterium]